jgi:hypothetical protein
LSNYTITENIFFFISDSGDGPGSGREPEPEDEGIEQDQDEDIFRRSGICQKIFRVTFVFFKDAGFL